MSTTPFLERVKAYAETYWQARLKAEELGRASNANLPPIEPQRFPPSVWPVRDPVAGRNQIDLSAYYTAPLNVPDGIVTHESVYDDDLSDLPTGLVNFAGRSFDVRGMVCLASASNAYLRGAVGVQRHPSIQGIPVGFSARRIHLLHTSAGAAPDGTLLYRCVLTYADGERREIPVLYGWDLRESWERDDDIKPETDRGVVVWRGTNPAVAYRGGRLHLYLRTFENPRPEVEIKSIDLVSAQPPCVPILIALTLEP